MVKNLRPLLNLLSIEELDIHFATINELIFLKNLRNLVKLDVSNNTSLYSIEGIERLNNLEEFNCSKTDIEDLTPMAKLQNLRILDVSDTEIRTLRPLQTIKSLTEIDCSNTAIKTLKYLYSNPNLKMISIRNTEIPKENIDIAKILKINYQPDNLVFELE